MMQRTARAADGGLRLSPVARETGIFRLPGWVVWCGSMIPGGDGKYYLLFSLWEEKYGFEGWIQHSKIGCAVAEDSMGPYRFQGIVLEGSGIPGAWDRDVVHNPWIIVHDGRFYLFYTGNYGNGDYRDHGRHQRIGLAVAPHPAGPWKRGPEPLLPGRPGMFDATMTTNPSVCRLPDGSYVMIYKCYSLEPPFNGKVVHGIAYAERPEGVWRRRAEPVFQHPESPFAAEDPCLFFQGGKLRCILKDMDRFFSPESARSLVMLESSDRGESWRKSSPFLISTREVAFEGGEIREMARLERPFVYMENGDPAILFNAAKPDAGADGAFNIHRRWID